MLKKKMCRNSLHTKGGLKESIQHVVFSSSPEELWRAMGNIFVECDTAL
jgi:hypothetical protein